MTSKYYELLANHAIWVLGRHPIMKQRVILSVA